MRKLILVLCLLASICLMAASLNEMFLIVKGESVPVWLDLITSTLLLLVVFLDYRESKLKTK